MLTWLIRRRLAAFERTHDYDLSYARELLDAGPRALFAFARVGPLGTYRKGIERDPYWAAKVVAACREDCGPCTQLVVTLALRDGASPDRIAAALSGDVAAMGPDVALATSFVLASMAREPAADELRGRVVARWGQRGLVSLSFAMVAARIYPTLKYALGYGHACQRVVVDGRTIVPSLAA